MVTILERGTERKRQVECLHCDSRLEYLKDDILKEIVELSTRQKNLRQFRGKESITHYFVECPDCGKRVYVD